jgi:hypothetical protein
MLKKLFPSASLLVLLTTFASNAKADLIAWYPLHGDAIAAVGVDGILVNGPTPAPDQHGTPNGALHFQTLPGPSGSYVSVPGGAGLAGLSQGTIALWVNWSGTQGSSFTPGVFGNVVARQANSVYSNNVLGISSANPALGHLTWQPYNAGPPVAVGATPVGDNVWHFVAVTFNGVTGEQKLYLDGNLDGTGTAFGVLNSFPNNPFTIGAWIDDGHGYSNSTIHDVRIFDTVLSQSEIQALQAADAVPEPSSLALFGIGTLGLLGYAWRRWRVG